MLFGREVALKFINLASFTVRQQEEQRTKNILTGYKK